MPSPSVSMSPPEPAAATGAGPPGKSVAAPAPGAFRLLLIDPSTLGRSCFVAALEGASSISVSGVATVDELTAALIEAISPNVIALRITGESLREEQLIQRLERLGRLFPPARTILLAHSEAPDQLLNALRMGLGGFITTELNLVATIKAMEVLNEGLSVFSYSTFQSLYRLIDTLAPKGRKVPSLAGKAVASDANLTGRQREVLQLLVDGLSNKEIAYRLGISESTVKVHIRAIMERSGVISRTQIVSRYLGQRR